MELVFTARQAASRGRRPLPFAVNEAPPCIAWPCRTFGAARALLALSAFRAIWSPGTGAGRGGA